STFFNNFSAPVISLLSFIALLWTIFQQNKSHNVSLEELRLTREEIELTRDEMAKATIAHENQAFALQEQVEDAKNTAIEQKDLAELQSRATQLQQFENTFYSLLAEHNQLLLQISNNKYLVNVVNEERGAHNTAMSTLRRELLLDPNVCRYYRTLYQLLKFIARNHPGNSEKTYNNEYLNGLVLEGEKSYSSLVRSTIPTNVLLALAINCVDGYEETHAFHKYFLLVERFNFLEHLVFAKYINYARRGGFSEISHPNVYYTILGTYSKKSFDKNESSKVRLQELETLLDKKDDGLLRLIAANPPRENSALDVLVKQHGDQV
ncbi:putative phage abortive infection protein, partial [Vibrio sp. 10N.261.55.A7]|uniref:putative phage abortive infection protein n=1 Tax=Vibrio sp. 10N.261.55.A7 TaxID=1880851 RepID=UPI0018E45D98